MEHRIQERAQGATSLLPLACGQPCPASLWPLCPSWVALSELELCPRQGSSGDLVTAAGSWIPPEPEGLPTEDGGHRATHEDVYKGVRIQENLDEELLPTPKRWFRTLPLKHHRFLAEWGQIMHLTFKS